MTNQHNQCPQRRFCNSSCYLLLRPSSGISSNFICTHPYGWYFLPIPRVLSHKRLSVSLCCRIQLPQQSSLFSLFSLPIIIQTGLLNKISRTFHRRIFIRRTLHPLHQSVNLLNRPVFSLLFCQIFPFHLFCNNHTSKLIILIATCTMIYSFFMMSTQQNISNF